MSERHSSTDTALSAPAPFLFSAEAISAITKEQERIVASEAYSAEELQRDCPAVYQEIVRLRALGVSKRGLQRIFGVHFYTVAAVCDQQEKSIEALRLKLGRKALGLGALLMDSLEGDVISGKLKPGEKAFAINTLITQGQLLSGGATARIEGLDAAPEKEGFEGWLAKAKPANGKVIEAETSPVEMGSEAAGKSHCAPGSAGVDRVTTEDVSVDRADDNSVKSADVTPRDTDSTPARGEIEPSDDQGGRGSRL